MGARVTILCVAGHVGAQPSLPLRGFAANLCRTSSAVASLNPSISLSLLPPSS